MMKSYSLPIIHSRGNNVKKRRKPTRLFSCFLLTILSIVSTSCYNEIPETDTSILTVSIQKDTAHSTEPEITVLFNCISTTGKNIQAIAKKNAKGLFEATVPAACQPDKRFIVICIDGKDYCFKTANTGFEAGRRYNYAFKMNENKPEPVTATDIEIEIEDWHIIDTDIEMS